MADNAAPNTNGTTPAEKHARGRELLENRTNTTLDKLRTIGNLSAKTYGLVGSEYTAALDAIRAECDRIESMFVNGKPLEEPYVIEDYRDNASMPPRTIDRDHFFVLGDHRNSSNDSRNWGTVPRYDIYGKAVFVYWPLDRLGLLH